MDANVPDAGKYGEKLPENYVIFITRYLKQDQKGVSNMCKAMEELIEEDKIESAEKMLQGGKLSVEEIADYLTLSLEKVKELALQLQPQMA